MSGRGHGLLSPEKEQGRLFRGSGPSLLRVVSVTCGSSHSWWGRLCPFAQRSAVACSYHVTWGLASVAPCVWGDSAPREAQETGPRGGQVPTPPAAKVLRLPWPGVVL